MGLLGGGASTRPPPMRAPRPSLRPPPAPFRPTTDRGSPSAAPMGQVAPTTPVPHPIAAGGSSSRQERAAAAAAAPPVDSSRQQQAALLAGAAAWLAACTWCEPARTRARACAAVQLAVAARGASRVAGAGRTTQTAASIGCSAAPSGAEAEAGPRGARGPCTRRPHTHACAGWCYMPSRRHANGALVPSPHRPIANRPPALRATAMRQPGCSGAAAGARTTQAGPQQRRITARVHSA